MNPQNIQNIKPITAIGRTFYLLLPVKLGDLELQNIIFNLEQNLRLKQKIRILIDDYEQLEKVQSLLCELQEKMQNQIIGKTKLENDQNLTKNLENKEKSEFSFEFNIYQTNFFQLETAQITSKIEQNPTLNWQTLKQNGFQYCQIFPNDEHDQDFQTAMNFFLTSFGSDFVRDLDGKLTLIPDKKAKNEIEKLVLKALKNPANKIFLVKKNQSKQLSNTNLKSNEFGNKSEVVGAFSFLEIGNEVQLHYTAGKTTIKNNFEGKKLPILTATMLDILTNYPNYKQTKKLTFSNKDQIVSKAYESVGFELLATRKCLLVK